MDYSPLVSAIQEGDEQAVNRLVSEATPILIRMLMYRMGASREEAEDAVQQMYVSVIQAIRENRIRNPKALLSYMTRASKNNYAKRANRDRDSSSISQVGEPSEPANQLSALIDEEKMQVYESCIESLKPKQREFIRYWLANPDATASDVADRFDISESNAWTRKHRIINMLRECVKKRW